MYDIATRARRGGFHVVAFIAGIAFSAVLRAQGAPPKAAPAAAATPAGAPITPAPAFTAAQLNVPPTTSWPTNGGSLTNERFSPLTQINRNTIKDLKGVWRTHLDGSGMGAQHSAQAQPLFYDGVLYMVTGQDDAFALSVDTGKILWSYKPNLQPERVKVCCGWVSRGVALGDGKVFVGQLDAKLVALDQRTGKVAWTAQAEDPLFGYSMVGAPLYYDGMVIIGISGGDMGIRGSIKSYDAKTGKLLWTFYTIPAPGEFGSNTWPSNNDFWKYGGAGIWQTPAVDPDLGLIYFSTGNAGNSFNSSSRPGDNLFTDSILALDVKTGKYRWHFQQVHHDIWDYDSPNPVVLFDADFKGVHHKALAQVSKTGWVYILDRQSGKPILGIEERPVPQEPHQHTAATQPYVNGDSVVPQKIDIAPEGFDLPYGGRIFTPFWDKPVVYRPQMAVNWPPSSYDPATHLFYFCGIDNVGNSVSDLKAYEKPQWHGMWLGGGGAYSGIAGRGVFGAIDLTTNKIKWEQQWHESCFSGSLTTAGGIVFVGRSDGRLTALDTRNGEKLWQFQTDSGVNAPASSFEYKGTQHIAVFAGGTLFGGGKKGDSLWLLSLKGKILSLPSQGPPTSIIGNGAPVPIAPGTPNVAAGKTVFSTFCVACHGDTGLGSHGGANLTVASHNIQLVVTTVSKGRNDMPSFEAVLKPEQIRDVAGYITNANGLFVHPK
ncbi:MAG TPA: PQQ-binding-like beta-propeller repeat protein [Steroidobacteraceae bacterium]|jgi:alcohol dehydrogenase (cytochrome c)